MVKTWAGAFLSMIILVIVLMFGILKLKFLLLRKNPTIVSNKTPLDITTTYSLGSDEFMMAFFAENYWTGAALSDRRYVNWVTRLVVIEEGTKTKTWYPMHKCKDE